MDDFTRRLGMETTKIAEGHCVIELDLDDRHMSVARRAHGGVLFTMLDTAMGRSVISRLPEGRGCATIEAKINYFRPVRSGRIRAEASCMRLTRKIGYAEGTLTDAEGHVLARASGTFFLTETLEQADRERV
ncbi:MAG: PaaI family thioesterase [Myxococcota bacterium]|nr:PaaI family thioesterase [Myxococcota bacterium]